MSSIHYTVRGEGLPLLLIHGFCESGEIWHSLASNISEGFQVVTIDLPGFGGSKMPDSPFTLEEIGAELNNWVVEHGFENSILMGHSLGGYVSLAMVAQAPNRYRAFGLIHSTARADTEVKRLNRIKVNEFVKSNGVEGFVDSFVPGLYYQKNHPSIEFALKMGLKTTENAFKSYTIAMRDRPSREDVLSDSEVPILIIGGQKDTVIPIESLKEQASLNARTCFYSLPDVGHMGMFEAEEATKSIVNRFISEVKSRPWREEG